MTYNRRPISLLASVALGIGAALLVLVVGGRPAAAAPATVGDSKPATANQCFARDDSATGTVYSSTDSAAIRQGVAAAIPNDVVRLAGTCAGVAAQGGTSQTVVITQALTLIGGLSPADWVDTFPITQPTILDAQGLGRVITASADITIGALTVQYGQSFGGNGGGVYAGANLTALGAVNFLSNTTLVTTTKGAPCCFGGGFFAQGQVKLGQPATQLDVQARNVLTEPVVFQNNSAYNGGAGYSFGNVVGDYINVINNLSLEYGNLTAIGTLTVNHANFDGNNGYIGAALVFGGDATFQNSTCTNNNASFGTCLFGINGAPANVTLLNDLLSYNVATNDGAVISVGNAHFLLNYMRVENNTVTGAGNVLTLVDSSGSIVNSLFVGNTAPQGALIHAERFSLADPPTVFSIMAQYQALGVFAGAAATTTGSVNPLGSSTAPTGTAIFASGATVLLTDTIISGYGTDLETDAAPSSTIREDYSLFYPARVISGTGITTGTHSIVGNPMFADALGHLSAGSPAIDHGIDVGINVDLDGNHRPSGAGFDIGAYEFQFAMAKLFLPLVRR